MVTSSPRVTKYAMKATKKAAAAGPKMRAAGKKKAIAGAAGIAVAGTAAAVSAHHQAKAGPKLPKQAKKTEKLNQKAVTAQKVAKYAGYAGMAGAGLGLAAKHGAGMKLGGQVGQNVLNKSAKSLTTAGGISTGAAVAAAAYGMRRDKRMGVQKSTRRLNAAGTAVGLTDVKDRSTQIKMQNRVTKKAQPATKSRSQCKGNCLHK